MGLREAGKYIATLHEKQADPLNWPDFLTGLPDHAAVVRKVDDVYDKLDTHCVVYFRIENIEPYLAKYGTEKHVEIIEWAAAILKSTMDKYNGFLGTVGVHEFLIICKAACCEDFISSVQVAFSKKIKDYYSDEDIKKGEVMSFKTNGGKKVSLGIMHFKHSMADDACSFVPKDKFLICLKELCS
jgi:GGDEF domain-containing protein